MTGARVCEPRTDDDGGLVGLTAQLVDRDLRRIPMYLAAMIGGDVKAGPALDVELEHADLVAALARDDLAGTRDAAFLAGRCTAGPDADAETRAALHALLERFDPGRLRTGAAAYAETLFSLALWGEPDLARRGLADMVAGPYTLAGSLAAGYLAQLGDPAGYPRLLEELHDPDDPHGRMMAARELLAFVPHDGADVDGVAIDVRAALLGQLGDDDPFNAAEAPGLLLETGLPGVADDLRRALDEPHPEPVLAAIRGALEHG